VVACALASAVTVQAQVNLPFLDTPYLWALCATDIAHSSCVALVSRSCNRHVVQPNGVEPCHTISDARAPLHLVVS
jgi:hypothetical protein